MLVILRLPLTLREEICLMGLWRHMSPEEAANPSSARDWLTRCNPQHSPDRAYLHYQELGDAECRNLFSFSRAWSAENFDRPTIKRALRQMPPAKLEKLVLVRLQGLHPPWVQDDDWEFFMRFVLEVERQKSWSVVLPHADPRHPGYNGTNKRVAPDPVIVECSGLGGGDLNLAQPWHVCVKTNKHKQQVYGPSLALVEESLRLSDHSTVHYTGLGLTKSLQEFLVLHHYATDSAASWYSLLQGWFPQVRWTSPGQLRYLVRQIYRMVHIAPSHRRTPHPCWTGPMNLLFSLILGHGRKQIVSLLCRQRLGQRFFGRVVCRTDGSTSSLEVASHSCTRSSRGDCLSARTVGGGSS